MPVYFVCVYQQKSFMILTPSNLLLHMEPTKNSPMFASTLDTESDSQFFSRLSLAEVFWRDRYNFLLDRGYKLRPRYHPDWVPSWIRSGITPATFLTVEDACLLPLRSANTVDATRKRDDKRVYIKRIQKESDELRFMQYLSSSPLRNDPRNHAVPLLEALEDLDPNFVLIIMPFLQPLDDPPFENVGELFDFGDQILEGLVFLHEQGIAHRDCAYQNIRMDATPLFPDGFHPVHPGLLPDMSASSSPIPRSSTAGVTYYFIDFGISVKLPPPDTDVTFVIGSDGLDQEPPELHQGHPYDPFKLDIFIIGNLFRRRFLDVFSNLELLTTLIEHMTSEEPEARPDARQALEAWRAIRRRVNFISRNWRLKRKKDPLPVQLILDVYGLVKAGLSSTSWRRYL